MTGYLLSFGSIFSLILSFVIDWIVLIEWQLRHSSVTYNQYIIVPLDGQMAAIWRNNYVLVVRVS